MTAQEKFLSKRQRYRPISLPQSFSDEQMVKDWTLSESDREEIGKYSKNFRLFIAIQICSIPLYGRFLNQVHALSPHIVNYLGQQPRKHEVKTVLPQGFHDALAQAHKKPR